MCMYMVYVYIKYIELGFFIYVYIVSLPYKYDSDEKLIHTKVHPAQMKNFF